MSPHHIAGMAHHLSKSLSRAVPEKFLEDWLEEYWEGRGALVWEVEDVLWAFNHLRGEAITVESAEEILNAVIRNHDAGQGVCWETFASYSDMAVSKKLSVDKQETSFTFYLRGKVIRRLGDTLGR